MCKKIEIFTDGSCLGNPGKGAYAAILRYNQYEKIFSQGYYLTTNNRMELMAVIIALQSLKEKSNVVLNTDSQYVRIGVTKWINTWKKRNWKNFSNKIVKNIDLWHLLDMHSKIHLIQWNWIKSHNGHPENERCNKLAREIALNPTKEDFGYRLNL